MICQLCDKVPHQLAANNRWRLTYPDGRVIISCALGAYLEQQLEGVTVENLLLDPAPSIGATLVAQRWAKVGPVECSVCAGTFEGRTGRDGPRYCSDACRQRAWRERQATKTT